MLFDIVIGSGVGGLIWVEFVQIQYLIYIKYYDLGEVK